MYRYLYVQKLVTERPSQPQCTTCLRSEADKGALNPKDNSIIGKDTSTYKGFHATFAA